MKLRRLPLTALIVLILLSSAVLAGSRSSYSFQDRLSPLAGMSSNHHAGTDSLGRDRLVRVSAALLLSLGGAVGGSILSTGAAALVGALAGLSSTRPRMAIMLICDVFLSLPWLFLLMIVRSILPLTMSPLRSAATTFLILSALGWPAAARAVGIGIMKLKNTDWMIQFRAAGMRPTQLLRQTIPHLVPLLLPQFLISVPAFVVAEANLGALGLGIGEPLPSFGGMLLELDNSATLSRTNWVFLPIALLGLVLLLIEAVAVEE